MSLNFRLNLSSFLSIIIFMGLMSSLSFQYPDDGNHNDDRYVGFGPSRAFPVGSHNIGTGGPTYAGPFNGDLGGFDASPGPAGVDNSVGQVGYVTNRVVEASPRVAVDNAISGLSSPEASSRTSSAISSLISNGQISINTLPVTISNLTSLITSSSP
ncbi:uncharacterized protein LOC128387305 [Panonychus citri]|uniref:uncharacterized protein LOC128387305 n=1 Tax=Panonychus citri TaxID=50023 RepID=UPI002307168A|nr:uncharacterized protein LOC128387305 [Panonychus citri]